MLAEENEDRKRLGFLEDGSSANGTGHADAENGEVQTVNIWRGGKQPGHEHTHDHQNEHSHAKNEASQAVSTNVHPLTKEYLDELLTKLPSEDVWRVKGFLKVADSTEAESSTSYFILNWAFGRYELHPASERMSEQLKERGVDIRLTVMGARGEAKRRARMLAQKLQAEIS